MSILRLSLSRGTDTSLQIMDKTSEEIRAGPSPYRI